MENIVYTHSIIAPKTGGFVLPAVILLLLVFLLIGIMFSMRNTTITVTDKNLIIKSLFYGRTVPLEKINVNGLRLLNLNHDSEYNVKFRSNGIGLPGFYAGWMRLNNGNRSLVFLTDRTSVVLIPTAGYDILFSTNDFNGIKTQLNRNGSGS